MAEHTREGADKAGRDVADLDLGAWTVTVVSEDSAAAKRAARILVAFYISSMPPEQLARHGIEASELQPVVDALGGGDIPKAVELFKPEYAEKLCLAGTPEEVVEKIKTDMQPAGVNHMVLAIADPAIVKLFSGEEVENVPDFSGQLRLVAEQVMPAFEGAVR
jgi:5,10-methylenetetrahydromethanopterin reductase